MNEDLFQAVSNANINNSNEVDDNKFSKESVDYINNQIDDQDP